MSNADCLTAACVVCGARDARALSTTRLARGEVVVVCGTHEVMHRRLASPAETVTELRSRLSERRASDRRGSSGDELADALAAAFCSREARSQDRRGG